MPAEIIENIVPAKRIRELVRLVITVLFPWAKSGKTDMTLWINEIELFEAKMRKEKQPRRQAGVASRIIKS